MVRLLLAALLVAGAGGAIPAPDQRPPFPSVNLRDRQGQVQPLSELLGEVTVLNFWATWCGPCRHELPELERLATAFRGKPLKVLAINVDSPRAAVEGLRPPVFFKSRPGFERALRLWRPDTLSAAGAALLEVERAIKTTGMPAEAVARAAVLGLAREAVRARRG